MIENEESDELTCGDFRGRGGMRSRDMTVKRGQIIQKVGKKEWEEE